MPKKGKGVALKYDGGKEDLSLLPRVFKAGVAQAMMAGAVKYSRYNYLEGFRLMRLLASAERHLDALKDGEDLDPETGVPHWALLAANCLMIAHCAEYGTLEDDRVGRPKKKRAK
jgi:hypothetical protein